MLDADERATHATDAGALHERDREIGRSLAHLSDRPLAQLAAWDHARRVMPDARDTCPGDPSPAVTAACTAVGLLAGGGTALGGFFYDGAGRVNVLLLLALFVFLPLVTLLVAALGATSRHGIRSINPGALAARLARALPAGGARELGRLAAGARGPRVAKWLALSWAQWMGLGFGAGALLTAIALVLFTDLAFGWSTTLDVSAAGVQRMSEALALPWRAVLPGAVPEQALVDASRFFRVAPNRIPADPALLGRWWPFVVMAMLVYGLAPRLLSVIVCHWRLSRACADALLTDPRVHDLLDRMNTPLVETRSPDDEVTPAPGPTPRAFAALPRAEAWQVVNWAEVPVDTSDVAQALGGAPLLQVHAAGGACKTADDEVLAATLAASPAGTGILVIARAFEAPTLELMDFLTAVRTAAPAAMPVLVLPAAVSDGALAPASIAHGATWREALARDAPVGVRAITLHAESTP